MSRAKLAGNQDAAGEAQHGLVNLDHPEMEVGFPRRNEIRRRFLDAIRLHIEIVVDDGEPQLPRVCPQASSSPNSLTLSQKRLRCGSETGPQQYAIENKYRNREEKEN
jgi:hypothetical protein